MKHLKSFIITLLISGFIFSLASEVVVAGTSFKNTLRYGETIRPDTFDPYTSSESSSLRLTELLFNGLLSINEKQEVIPDLAERWEISNENRTFTFFLRNNVYWHNKELKKYPLTADDVIFTINLISHDNTQSSQKHIFDNFKSIIKIDEYTFQIEMKDEFIGNLALFQFKILPKHILEKSTYLTKKNPFVNHPIGTGPYKFLRSNHNREVTLVANPVYYNGEPKIKKIIAKPFADKNIMNQALNFNALDLIVSVSPRNIAELQVNRNFKLISYNTLSYSFFAYNHKNQHLAKQKVRKALSYAINRDEMIRAFFNGQGRIISGPFAPGSWAYNLNVRPDTYQPAKAIALLNESGYKKTANGMVDNNGKALSFKLRVPINKNDEATKRVILAYKNYLKKIGITVVIDFMERQAWKKAIFTHHRYDITFASWSFDDASDISSLFHSRYQTAGQNNFILYKNDEVDRLLDLNQKSLDYEEKRTINHKLHEIIAKDSPYTFLWSLSHYSAYNKKLSNVNIHPFKFFNHIENWEKH